MVVLVLVTIVAAFSRIENPITADLRKTPFRAAIPPIEVAIVAGLVAQLAFGEVTTDNAVTATRRSTIGRTGVAIVFVAVVAGLKARIVGPQPFP